MTFMKAMALDFSYLNILKNNLKRKVYLKRKANILKRKVFSYDQDHPHLTVELMCKVSRKPMIIVCEILNK